MDIQKAYTALIWNVPQVSVMNTIYVIFEKRQVSSFARNSSMKNGEYGQNYHHR